MNGSYFVLRNETNWKKLNEQTELIFLAQNRNVRNCNKYRACEIASLFIAMLVFKMLS